MTVSKDPNRILGTWGTNKGEPGRERRAICNLTGEVCAEVNYSEYTFDNNFSPSEYKPHSLIVSSLKRDPHWIWKVYREYEGWGSGTYKSGRTPDLESAIKAANETLLEVGYEFGGERFFIFE